MSLSLGYLFALCNDAGREEREVICQDFQVKRVLMVRRRTLLRVVDDNGWSRPGDGNFNYYLEQYAFYKDRKFHNTDVYNARGKATLVPLFVRPLSLCSRTISARLDVCTGRFAALKFRAT